MKILQLPWVAMVSALAATGAARAQDDDPNKPIRPFVPVPARTGQPGTDPTATTHRP